MSRYHLHCLPQIQFMMSLLPGLPSNPLSMPGNLSLKIIPCSSYHNMRCWLGKQHRFLVGLLWIRKVRHRICNTSTKLFFSLGLTLYCSGGAQNDNDVSHCSQWSSALPCYSMSIIWFLRPRLIVRGVLALNPPAAKNGQKPMSLTKWNADSASQVYTAPHLCILPSIPPLVIKVSIL